jgi:hypothetical protein
MRWHFKPVIIAGVLAFLLITAGLSIASEDVKAAPISTVQAAPVSSALCLTRGEIPEEEMHWLYVPASPSELHTEVNYGYLAGQLIKNGYIDASHCPNNGLGITGYANACGLAAAKPAVVEIQNMYDQAILDAFRDTSTPPVMLKQLLRYESQFWPGTYGLHYGIGHLTYYGAYTALHWSPILAQIACNAAYGNQCKPNTIDDYTIGVFIAMMSPSCPTCTYGIDEAKAVQSISYLSHALLAYCRQTTQIVTNATGVTPDVVVDYSMIWRLTLFNYNVGPNCLYNAVGTAWEEADEQVDWETFSEYVDDPFCERGLDYVNKITEPFYEFTP